VVSPGLLRNPSQNHACRPVGDQGEIPNKSRKTTLYCLCIANIRLKHFRRPLVSSDFDTFHKYERRIKSVSYETSDLSEDTAEVLCSHELPMPMLPNLRELVVKDVTGRSPCIAHLFLGPRLESIRMAHLQQSESVLAFVHSINTHCLSLKRLDINLLTVQYLFQALPKLILGRVELESLKVPYLSSEILAHITTWSRLRHSEVISIITEDIGPISGSGLTHITNLELGSGYSEGPLAFNKFLSLCRPYQLQPSAD
jgi:hypothetical protein